MYVSRVFFTSVIKRVFVSLPLAIYIKFLAHSHFKQNFGTNTNAFFIVFINYSKKRCDSSWCCRCRFETA